MSIRKLPKFFAIAFFIATFLGCERDYDGYYDVPSNLEGPLYEQLAANDDFSAFKEAIDKVPELPRIINTSGLYTIFAPTNEAWSAWLKKHNYSSTNDVPAQQLKEVVENHILFAMWYEYDFNRLISDEDYYKSDKTTFEVRSIPALEEVISTPGSLTDDIGSATEGDPVKVFHDYRQIGVYTSKFLEKQSLKADYQRIYGAEPSDINFGEAQVVTDDISAKNGVIYGINKVVEPLHLASTYLRNNPRTSTYYDFMEKFIELDYSEEYSEQYGNGEEVYTIKFNFPGASNYTGTTNLWGTPKNTWTAALNFANENHEMSVLAPSNEVIEAFAKEKYIPEFATADDMPILAQYYMIRGSMKRSGLIWPSDEFAHITTIGDTLNVGDVLSDPTATIQPTSNGIVYVGGFRPPKYLRTVGALSLMDWDYEWTARAVQQVLPEEEKTASSAGLRLIDLMSAKSDAADGKFTYLTPSNEAWTNYGFTSPVFKFEKPDGSIMNNLTSSKLWMIIKSHLLLGALDQTALMNGTLPNGYYPTASRLYIKYKNGKFFGYNRDVSKVDTYEPNLVSVIGEDTHVEDNGIVTGVDGIIDMHIASDNSFFNLTENKKAMSDLSYKPFMDKCNAVFLFQDGEIDFKDDFKVQNLTVFALTSEAISEYDDVIAGYYSALANKSEVDSLEWTNAAWRNTLKGHFVWNPNDPYKRIFIDNETYAGGEMYPTEGVTFFQNTPVTVAYEGGKAMLKRNGVSVTVPLGIKEDGTSLATENTKAVNEQCLNAVVHLVDKVLPLPGLE
ncbi:hypothetical protein EYV94_10240 [Puteibacter caeruleilacunae]|nr:hypothetical protein EYV94_10240 [Puteibacter caeruleilacunae]